MSTQPKATSHQQPDLAEQIRVGAEMLRTRTRRLYREAAECRAIAASLAEVAEQLHPDTHEGTRR